VTVFKPEVENISKQIDGVCIVLNAIEPSNDFFLSLEAGLWRRNAKVKVGREVDFLPFEA
jgi:hypothetical protein